jgi:heme A synthase
MAKTPEDRDERRYWLDDPANVTRIVWTLVGVCVLLFVASFFYESHGVFAVEHVFGFYALFGFAAYVALIFLAKGLRTVLLRPEDYYDRDYRGPESTPGQD